LSAKLAAALNASQKVLLPWPASIDEEVVELTDEQILSMLQENNPRLKELDAHSKSDKTKIELAKKDYFPDITVGVDYIDTASAVFGNPPDSGNDPVILMFSMNVPIWHEKYRAAENQARARYMAKTQERNELENTLTADLKMALYRFRDSQRRVELYGHSLIPKADQSLAVARRGFEAGKVAFLDLIDAERTLLEFELAYERARTDRSQRLAEIEMLTGTRLSSEEGTANLQNQTPHISYDDDYLEEKKKETSP
jgi:outer membrane protein TolC